LFAEDTFFGKLDQAASQTAIPEGRGHGEGLDVACKRAPHDDDDKSGPLTFGRGYVPFIAHVVEYLQRRLVIAAYSEPGLGIGHQSGAPTGILLSPQRIYRDLLTQHKAVIIGDR